MNKPTPTEKPTGVNLRLPAAIHRRLKADAALRGLTLTQHIVNRLTAGNAQETARHE